jgi:serine/threonine-protein kinase HipA
VSKLGVWMNGRFVGTWQQLRGGRDRFTYDKAWQEDPQYRLLSLSIPMTATGEITDVVVGNYFDNLLPDNPRIRERLRNRFSARSAGTFDLLEAIGRDCVGAVQLLPQENEPEGWNRIDSSILKPKEVETILRAVPTADAPRFAGIADDDDFRISLAGAQEKTALTRIGRTWHRPIGSTPTTHILKLPLGTVGGMKLDLSHSVDNEWLCAALCEELGLMVAKTSIGRFGEQRPLIVERFDRRWQNCADKNPYSTGFIPARDAWIARLPQEDFCQVAGIGHDKKYESRGGPGISAIMSVLSRSERAAVDQQHFLLSTFAFWLLAAIDGHAKNFSIHHARGGGFSLTPLYDVLSAWPVIGKRADQLQLKKVTLAMALRGTSAHYKLTEIKPRHFEAMANEYPAAAAWPAMINLAQRVETAIQAVEKRLPEDLAEVVWTTVCAGLRAQTQSFLSYAKEHA